MKYLILVFNFLINFLNSLNFEVHERMTFAFNILLIGMTTVLVI